MVGRRRSAEYTGEDLQRVLDTCRVLAATLGDLAESVTVVGGVVPALLVQQGVATSDEQHPGTTDLDIAVTLVSNADAYEKLVERLTALGFEKKEEGGKTREYKWVHASRAEIDIIVVDDQGAELGGRLSEVRFAFWDREEVNVGAGGHLCVRRSVHHGELED